MKQLFFILPFIFITESNVSGQVAADSIYKSWVKNKSNSIFESINSGTFSGTTTGYIQVISNVDTMLLDFQASKTNLKINKIAEPVYDDNTKVYSTQTTSGKTFLQYETFMLANVLTIVLNGVHYGIGVFDGASDTPVAGLMFNYCHEKNTEYLTLFITKPLRLTTSAYLFNKGNISYQDASKNEKVLIVLPGSTLILTVHK
ncbi:MAG: hypothetical protein ACTHJT_04385 [Cytophaga sp.]|uniref:hypothetical protein n=1 Tax=Cytophaga sp. TaxID=29535 RepID=UPI003F7F28CF